MFARKHSCFHLAHPPRDCAPDTSIHVQLHYAYNVSRFKLQTRNYSAHFSVTAILRNFHHSIIYQVPSKIDWIYGTKTGLERQQVERVYWAFAVRNLQKFKRKLNHRIWKPCSMKVNVACNMLHVTCSWCSAGL
ncbi:hypothetical protein QTP88_024318 [Uroleucon formosanum]